MSFRNFNRNKFIRTLDDYRIYIVFIVIFIIMSSIAPKFLNLFNMTTLLKGMSMNAMLASGFTIVLICGHLDLSVGSVLKLSIVLVIGLQPQIGWVSSILLSLLAGAAVGLLNGLLVAKLKIHSFIVTLGTMIIVQGIVLLYSGGGSLSINDFTLGDWIESSKLLIFTPRVLITVIIIVFLELFLTKTKYGKRLYMVGGNKETAWLGGLKTDSYIIIAFLMSGLLSAIGGILVAISLSAFVPSIGDKSLIVVIAAVIIGGTKMSGGKGSVFKSMIAILALTALFNGLSGLGTPHEARLFASGLVLAVVILYEAFANYKNERVKGQRSELLKELKK